MDPNLFFEENVSGGNEDVVAEVLCAGCTVVHACAADALEPMDVNAVLAALGHMAGEPDLVPVTGVVRAGVLCK